MEQATAYGLMVGASEAGLSYLLSGIPGLRGGDGVFSAWGQKAITKVDNALAKAAIALGGDMLDEGLEEGLQTVLENWFKEIATGVDFEDPSAEEILYSSLLGALTAAGFGGGKLAISGTVGGVKNYIKYNKTGKSYANMGGQNGIGALAAQGLGLNQNTAAYKQAQKMQAKLDAGKSASNYSVGKLLSSMSESQTVTAIQTRLSAHIENKNDVRKLSNTITDILFGEEVSDSALSGVAANKYALNTLNDVLGVKLKSGATVSDVKAAVKSYQTATTSKSGANASTNAKQGSEVKNSGRAGATFSVQENADGRFDVIAEASGNSGSIASYETRNQAQAAAYAMTLGMGAEGLSGLVNLSANLPDGVDLGEAAQAFNAIYSQGKNGKAFSAVKFGELLSPEQRQYAYNLGIMDKALDSARKNSSGEVLQNKAESGKMVVNQLRKDIDDEASTEGSESSKVKGRAERNNEKGDARASEENENGSSVQTEKRSERRIAEGILLQRNGRGVTKNSHKYKFDEKDFVAPPKDSVAYYAQKQLSQYGIECYVVSDSAWNRKSWATSSGGIVYLRETIPSEHRKRIGAHEATHIMHQVGYKPYLDFIDRCTTLFDFSTQEARDLLYGSAKHCGVDLFSDDQFKIDRVYDEFNATLYGHIAANLLNERTAWMKVAFYDFDAYVKELSDIHEQFKRDMKAQRIETSNQIDDSAIHDVQHAKSDQASSSEWDAERIKDGKVEKAKPISEIIERIRHDFGIHITKGHVRGKGVLGQYSRKNHGIRTKIANDLPTVAHELGHALDQRYSLTDKSKLTKEMRSELINALGDLKDSYKQNLWVSEGFAEYLRRFLQNRDDATRSYPEFTKHFLNSLSKADRVLMDTFADEINAYYALDADTATSSIRLREEGTPDARTALEKAKEMGDGVYQAWVDANHGIRLFDEATGGDTYKLAANAAYSDAIAGQIITGDLTDANGQYVAPGLKSALEGVNIGDKRIYREFGEYLVLRHGPERLNEGMMIFADPRKNTASFMAERQAKLEAAHPEFKEAADRLYEFQKQFLRTWAVDTGLLPAEVAEAWAKRWDFYVPLNRVVGKAGTIGAKRGYANQNSTVKKAIGSGLDIVHPVDNIINNIVKMVNVGVRNNVMLQLTAQAETLGADAMFMEKVPTPMKKKTADLTGVKAKLHDAFGAAGIGELLAEVEGENKESEVAHRKSFSEQIDDVVSGKHNPVYDLYVGKTPDVLIDLGFENKPLLKRNSKIKEILSKHDEMSIELIKQIPDAVADPVMILKSKTNPNDSVVVITDILTAKGHMIIPVWVSQDGTYLDVEIGKSVNMDTNFVATAYGRNVKGLIEYALKNNEVLFYAEDKKRVSSLLATHGLQLPARLSISNSTISISHKNENVNKKFSTNSSEGKNGAKSEVWSKVDEIIESTIDDVLIQYGQGKAHGDVVTVLRNGKQEFWKINDALLLESLTNMSQKKMNGIMEAYAVVSRFMTSNCSQGKYGMYCFEAFCFLIEKYIPVLIIL